jgi:hypothetical protein
MRQSISSWISCVALLAACGGSGGDSVSPAGTGGATGVLLDSAVDGVEYATSAGLVGLTANGGQFSYGAGHSVTFKLGDVVLGVAPGAATVSPLDLVTGVVDETNENVINLARFLQTLDLDSDPTNGIEIDASVRQAAVGVTMDFSQSVADFQANEQANVDLLTAGLPGGSRALIPEQDAVDHLVQTLQTVVAGRYDGSFFGDDTGDFSVFIGMDGALRGWANSASDGLLQLTGTGETDGGFVAGDVSSGATFTGGIDSNGGLLGTWALPGENGTFLGSRTVSVAQDRDADLLATLAGTYAGTVLINGSPQAFEVFLDAGGNLTVAEDDLVGAIVSTSGTTGQLVGLSEGGTSLQGLVRASGSITGSFVNAFDGESGTFSGTKQ